MYVRYTDAIVFVKRQDTLCRDFLKFSADAQISKSGMARRLQESGAFNRVACMQVDVETGQVLRSFRLPAEFFGEGLVRVDNRLLQLTWKVGTLLEYPNIKTFHSAFLSTTASEKDVGVLRRDTGLSDGWGITWDGKHLIITDSSPTIRWLNATTLKVDREAVVMDGDRVVPWVNELEWINGQVC
jgi:glutaminyl-peptide cyclotransferase